MKKVDMRRKSFAEDVGTAPPAEPASPAQMHIAEDIEPDQDAALRDEDDGSEGDEDAAGDSVAGSPQQKQDFSTLMGMLAQARRGLSGDFTDLDQFALMDDVSQMAFGDALAKMSEAQKETTGLFAIPKKRPDAKTKTLEKVDDDGDAGSRPEWSTVEDPSQLEPIMKRGT